MCVKLVERYNGALTVDVSPEQAVNTHQSKLQRIVEEGQPSARSVRQRRFRRAGASAEAPGKRPASARRAEVADRVRALGRYGNGRSDPPRNPA